ncbi:hypothetical protein SISSUDRAFT_1032970 [Sistotremastrum suecicum HHB10207 ss-3]|uniref:F-box domain-containing protein n=1 Tax=Sistotremastrum suecicum HHB10207 ss-3 TaxID=1314776 RepID=A0A166DY12_9AGAM|nr:hypothetical protein SISSUDRAFT_1032970 [Sistotremastrum suecicum HHB10207 ss-3]
MQMERQKTLTENFLQCPELVRTTMDFMDKKSLSRCALLNKAMSEHALDAIYAHRHSFVRLLELLCPIERDATTGIRKFTRPIKGSDWDRFRHYSKRIHSLRVSNSGNDGRRFSPDSLIDLFSSMPPGHQFLPHLRKIEWHNLHPVTIHFLLMLSHDKIHDLFFSIASRDLQNGILFERLSKKLPNLRSLRLGLTTGMTERSTDQARKTLSEAIHDLPLLRWLVLPSELLSQPLLYNLSQLKHLQRLWATQFGPRSMTSTPRAEADATSRFPVLFEVAVSTAHLLSKWDYLLSGRRLVSLYIEVSDMRHLSVAPGLISSLSPTLRHLIVVPQGLSQTSVTSAPLTIAMLAPFLKLQLLETLVIDLPDPPRLNDKDLQSVATSFPEIQHLEICVRARGEPSQVSPTLGCLLPFAKHCRKLHSLGLYINASVVPSAFPHSQTVFSPNLQELHVFCSKIGEIHVVLDFLLLILPSHASIVQGTYSTQLQHMVGETMLHFPRGERNEELDEESIEYKFAWRTVGRYLEKMLRARKTLEIQRAEISRLQVGRMQSCIVGGIEQ